MIKPIMPNGEKFQLSLRQSPEDSKQGLHRSSSIQPKSQRHPRGRQVNKTLTVQERLRGPPDNSMMPTMQHRAKMAGQGTRNVSWKVQLNWRHKGFPEHGTLEPRHKDEGGVATED